MQELTDQGMTVATSDSAKPPVGTSGSRRVYRQGQSTGKPLDHRSIKLNHKELRVLSILCPPIGSHRKPMTIADIAAALHWTKTHGVAMATSWVRNSLRRPVRAGLVEHESELNDGTYIITDLGKRKIRELGAPRVNDEGV